MGQDGELKAKKTTARKILEMRMHTMKIENAISSPSQHMTNMLRNQSANYVIGDFGDDKEIQERIGRWEEDIIKRANDLYFQIERKGEVSDLEERDPLVLLKVNEMILERLNKSSTTEELDTMAFNISNIDKYEAESEEKSQTLMALKNALSKTKKLSKIKLFNGMIKRLPKDMKQEYKEIERELLSGV